jgi:hypothetical protein
VKPAIALIVLALLGAAPQEDEKERFRKETLANLEALPKLWADARFWIVTDGKKSGWVRYQVRREKLGKEDCFEVEYERANYLAPSERYRMLVTLNEFLSPRLFAFGRSMREFRVEKGKVGNSPFGPPPDPGNLVSFPELWAAVLSRKVGVDLKFSTVDNEEKVYPNGEMNYLGPQKTETGELQKFRANFTAVSAGLPEQHEMELWVKPDRTLARTRSTVKWRSDSDTKQRVEELQPVDPKEWETGSVELNEIRAAAQLSALGDMSLAFRWNDFDGNNRNDHWTADVSGLYRLSPAATKRAIQVISKEAAMADAEAMPGGREPGGIDLADKPSNKPVPLFGYYFKVLKKYEEKKGVMVELNDGSNRHEYYFAICAYPAEFDKTGRRTFFIDPERTVWWKDMEGKPVEDRPWLPMRFGWQKGALK